jgi:hypothetical protein
MSRARRISAIRLLSRLILKFSGSAFTRSLTIEKAKSAMLTEKITGSDDSGSLTPNDAEALRKSPKIIRKAMLRPA